MSAWSTTERLRPLLPNTVGSFECGCRKGYKLLTDGGRAKVSRPHPHGVPLPSPGHPSPQEEVAWALGLSAGWAGPGGWP